MYINMDLQIMALDSHKIMGLSGTQADNEVFGEYIKTNLKLYQLNHDIILSTDAAANYIRNEVRQMLVLGRGYGLICCLFVVVACDCFEEGSVPKQLVARRCGCQVERSFIVLDGLSQCDDKGNLITYCFFLFL